MNKNTLLVAGVIIAVAFSVVGFFKGGTNTVERVIEKIGASPGPDINSPYLSVNGITTWYYGSKLKTATTTVCSFKSPAATTTVDSAGIRFETSSTTASRIYIGWGAHSNATTTLLQETAIAANAKGTVVASTTPNTTQGITIDGLDDFTVVSPNNYINFGMKPTEANSIGTLSPVGSCYAILRQI